jgi:hypothetical protein
MTKLLRVLVFLVPAFCAAQDVIFEGMKTELGRAATLQLGQLEKPYYIAYSLDEGMSWSASATFGGLVSEGSSPFRIGEVQLRVGDYKFDNSNYGNGNARFDMRGFPLENDPLAVRQYLWLTTDSAYKGALQSIAQKRAALGSVTVSEQLADFAKAPKVNVQADYKPVGFDAKAWAARVRNASAAFNAFPALRTGVVEYSAVEGFHRMVSTEGTEIRKQESVASIQIRASAQAPDGMVMREWSMLHATSFDKLPSETELTRSARETGEAVMKLAAAPMGEAYSGPILFEGVAGPQLLAEILGRNLHIARKPVMPRGMPSQAAATELEGRRGVRIMPEMFDVVDDPARPLFGHEELDDEGVPAAKVSLVEKGVLKDFLRTRLPVRGYSESNGHARMQGGGPAPTNLIVTARETSTVAELKQKMLDLCQQRGLAYAIIVRKLDFPSTAPVEEARKIIAASGQGHPISQPLRVFKLYADGHEEQIRGVRLHGFNARSLKDILFAGDDQVTFDYIENGAPLGLAGYGNSNASVSVVAPSLLIDDLELVKIDDELPKLPVAPAPAMSASK